MARTSKIEDRDRESNLEFRLIWKIKRQIGSLLEMGIASSEKEALAILPYNKKSPEYRIIRAYERRLYRK